MLYPTSRGDEVPKVREFRKRRSNPLLTPFHEDRGATQLEPSAIKAREEMARRHRDLAAREDFLFAITSDPYLAEFEALKDEYSKSP